jgi:hypothetical protein
MRKHTKVRENERGIGDQVLMASTRTAMLRRVLGGRWNLLQPLVVIFRIVLVLQAELWKG